MISHKIILLGYMGSGKSAVGLKLGQAFDVDFIDLDDYIEQSEGMTIPEIFKTKGELYFRAQERKCFELLMNKSKPMIISLGGGTPCYYDTMDFIASRKDDTAFYLKASINTLSHRLFDEKSKRPLIAHLKSLDAVKEFIGKHLFERNNYYQKAHYEISTDEKSIDAIVSEIRKKLA